MVGTSLTEAALYVEKEPERGPMMAGIGFVVGLGLAGLLAGATFELSSSRLALAALAACGAIVALGFATFAVALHRPPARVRCAFCDHALLSRALFFPTLFEAHVVEAVRMRDVALLQRLPSARTPDESIELACSSCTGCGTVAQVRCRARRGRARVNLDDAIFLGPDAVAFADFCSRGPGNRIKVPRRR